MQYEKTNEVDLAAEDDEWLDEVLRQTFPASDPLPQFHRDPKSSRASEDPTTSG